MTSFVLSVDGYKPLTGAFEEPVVIPPSGLPADKTFYRVLHELELGGKRRSMPEVFPFFDNHFTPLNRGLQLLHKAINSSMTNDKWRAFWGYTRAFDNNQGYGMPGDPRADFVNNRDTKEEPIKQEALVCGGALLAMKYIQDGWLYPEYIDGHDPAPTAPYVLFWPWLHFTAINIRSNGLPGMFPPGMENAQVLLLAYKPIRIHLSKVVLWTGTQPPDPYKVYLNAV